MNDTCRALSEGDSLLEVYHDGEWYRISHDDLYQFEMLCLEGDSVKLSRKMVLLSKDHRQRTPK